MSNPSNFSTNRIELNSTIKDVKSTEQLKSGFQTIIGSKTSTFYELEHRVSCGSFQRGHVHKRTCAAGGSPVC